MKPIDNISIAKSIDFIKSLTFEDKVEFCENIQRFQPNAFLAIMAVMQEGASVEKLEHGINLLMVIHHAFYSHYRSLPLITRDMLRDALEGNVATWQSIDRGWLTYERAISLYPERSMLNFVIRYLKNNNLRSTCKENERLIIRIKMVLDSYAEAKMVRANNTGLH